MRHHRTKVTKRFGIIPIPIYTKSMQCKISCLYCPKQKAIPKSYLKNEDTLFASENNFSPSIQVEKWKSRINNKYPAENPYKIEVIILGGTFSDLPKKYRINFLKEIFDTLNGSVSKSLDQAILNNKNADFRACIVTIETRPDTITEDECNFLLEIGISKVELGVQSIYDEVLKYIGRPYNSKDISNATMILRNKGFKIGYHVMLNLPMSNIELDKHMLSRIAHDDSYLPDFIKIYPLTLVKDHNAQAGMWKLFNTKKWKPYTKEELIDLLYPFYSNIPEYLRVQRIQRQFDGMDSFYSNCSLTSILNTLITNQNIQHTNLRLEELYIFTSKIEYNDKMGLTINTYRYSKHDFFLTIKNDQGLLFGYLRLYLNSRAIIRELKIIGESSPFGRKSKIQGKGLGTRLLKKAEQIATYNGYKNLYVIASPGVRSYFENYGFKKTDDLLRKEFC